MPITSKIDKEQRLVLTTGSGIVTLQEILDHQKRLRSDPEFDSTFDQLGDFTPATSLDLTSAEVETVASGTLFAKTSRRAFVANDATMFGVGRMFEAYREMSGTGEQVKIFYDRDSALKWLLS